MIRAVLDTNVLVSGLIAPSGNEALIVQAARHGLLHPCLSADVLAEYADVLSRPKFAFEPDEIAALLAMLQARGELFQPGVSPFTSPDPQDSKFLACADAAQADVLVTGNRRDFPDSPYGPTRVVSAAELLDRITVEL